MPNCNSVKRQLWINFREWLIAKEDLATADRVLPPQLIRAIAVDGQLPRSFYEGSSSYGAISFAAAGIKATKAKQCQKGYSCGFSCVAKTKACKSALEGQGKTYAEYLGNQLKSGGKLLPHQRADADALGLTEKGKRKQQSDLAKEIKQMHADAKRTAKLSPEKRKAVMGGSMDSGRLSALQEQARVPLDLEQAHKEHLSKEIDKANALPDQEKEERLHDLTLIAESLTEQKAKATAAHREAVARAQARERLGRAETDKDRQKRAQRKQELAEETAQAAKATDLSGQQSMDSAKTALLQERSGYPLNLGDAQKEYLYKEISKTDGWSEQRREKRLQDLTLIAESLTEQKAKAGAEHHEAVARAQAKHRLGREETDADRQKRAQRKQELAEETAQIAKK